MTYPLYQTWLDMLVRRDLGLLATGFFTLCILVWPIVARATMPRLLPATRVLIVVVWWLSAALMCLVR